MAIDEVSLAELRRRSSAKWRTNPSDVLPAWVAEMDFTLAEPIAHALRSAVDNSDTGYPVSYTHLTLPTTEYV